MEMAGFLRHSRSLMILEKDLPGDWQGKIGAFASRITPGRARFPRSLMARKTPLHCVMTVLFYLQPSGRPREKTLPACIFPFEVLFSIK
jgi:hypothetical protein